MHYVYILQSRKTRRLYKGSTDDLVRRIKEHSNGVVTSTKSGLPWRLVYYEGFENKTDAHREELFLKSGKGRERVKHLLKEALLTQ